MALGAFEKLRDALGGSGIEFKVKVVAGAAINTNIAISGIRKDAELLAVLQVEPDNGVTGTMLTDRASEASVTSAGNIQLTTTNTTGKQLLVVYAQKVK